MAGKRDKLFTVRMFPWRAGLATAGQQTSIPEDQLWQAKNATGMLDGLMQKAPGSTQWGQTLLSPNPVDSTALTSFVTFLAGTSGFVDTDSSSDLIEHSTAQIGRLRTSVGVGSGTENYTLSHAVTAQSSGSEWSLRFVFSGTNLPVYTADATTPNTFVFRGQGADGSGKEFAIHEGGLYYKLAADNKYQLIADTEKVGEGSRTTLEVRCDDAAGVTTVYMDGTLMATVTSADMADAVLTGETDFEFLWRVEGSGVAGTQYNTTVVTAMYNDDISVGTDAEDPFTAVTIDGITDYQYVTKGGSDRLALVVAAGKYIYTDNGLLGMWTPLLARQWRTISFTQYRDTLLWVDSDGSQQSGVWQWDGQVEPELLEDAPSVQFADEHQQRVLASGDKRFPRRVYYTGVRQPKVWYSPSQDNVEDDFDVALEAGFVEIPSGGGKQVTAIWGDYYGTAIVWTEKGAWRWSGYGPTSYRLDRIAGVDVGCEGPNCVTQVGNDLWFLGRQGLQSLAATDKFGDLQTQFPSAPIQDLWTQNPTSVKRISTQFLNKAQLDYNPPQGLLYMAVSLSGELEPKSVFVYNVNTQTWLGPWGINSHAMANIEIGMPRIEVMAHGADEGIVHYTDQSRHDLATGVATTMVVQTAYFNGRSLPEGQLLVGLEKRWAQIRLYILPRGKWDFTVDAEVDSEKKMVQQTKKQNINKAYGLTDDWKIGENPDGMLRSLEELGVIKISPELRGPNMNVTISSEDNLAIQAIEVDFWASGYEEE